MLLLWREIGVPKPNDSEFIHACVHCISTGGEPAIFEELGGRIRTLRALNQYRVLAAEDDGALLPGTEKPVEPGGYYADVPRWSKELIGRPETHILITRSSETGRRLGRITFWLVHSAVESFTVNAAEGTLSKGAQLPIGR